MLAEALICLAMNVYHEARSGSPDEQVAVAHVVLNRVRAPEFPTTVCGVILQGGERRRGRCQFSWYCDGKPDRPYENAAWRQAKVVAQAVLSGATSDPTGGALYYHAPYVQPSWASSMELVHQDAAHIFYKPRRAAP